MRRIAWIVIVSGLALSPATAFAYTLQGEGCDGNGKECKVYCNNGQLAGSMWWNGSVWTDGLKWDPNKDKEAKAICAANGSGCV